MKIRRVMIHGVPPWAPSGYGLQARFLARALMDLGFEVAISAYGGVHETRPWHGIMVMSCGARQQGNGVIAGNYRRWQADLCIGLGDLWLWDPAQFKGINFAPIIPIDCQPLGIMDKHRLDEIGRLNPPEMLHPIAMSYFGQKMLEAAGYQAPVLEHCTEFVPNVEAGRRWRREAKIPQEMFLISKVGVNAVDDRKAFAVTLQAFQRFAYRKDDVGLYLHAEPQVAKAPNLAFMTEQLGLVSKERGSKVAFPDEWRRAVDDYDQEWMQGLYAAADVTDFVTKGEGFGCPSVDSLASGTPVIAADNSAMPEKIDPSYGWLVGGQGEWASHHHSWWQTPYVDELADAYEDAYKNARKMRSAAAEAGTRWSYAKMKDRLAQIMAEIDSKTVETKIDRAIAASRSKR